jgi:FtsH-binding integral membrane protein
MQSTYSSDLSDVKVSSNFMAKVYNWMFFALLISWATAYYVAMNKALLWMVMWYFMPLIILEFAFVILLSFLINRMPAFVAILLFIAYSLLNWLTLSVIFLAYKMGAIQLAFSVTAWTFLFMSLYWYFTKASLDTFWLVMRMWLFWLVLATLVNFFVNSPMTDYILCWVWVIVFTWLTAYDTQKIREMWEAWFANWESETKMSIIGALQLYLDFINLFLYILRLFNSKN